MARLGDIAKACKSKNAGPFELTLDIMFGDAATFERVRAIQLSDQIFHLIMTKSKEQVAINNSSLPHTSLTTFPALHFSGFLHLHVSLRRRNLGI